MPKNTFKLATKLAVPRLAKTLAATVSVGVLVLAPMMAHATTIQQQINALNAQNSQTQQTVNDLQLQASSYQDAIAKLQDQISAIQAAIAASQAEQAQLQQQIIADQQQIAEKKSSLADDIKTMYIDGQMTTIEELATSKNLSDYVDKEQYRTVVQNQLDSKIKEIAALQQQQQAQKAQVEQLLATQQQQQSQLSSDQAQQNQLLALNEGQQNQYNQQIQANKSQISALEAEQARINAANSRVISAAASGGSGGNCDNGHGNGGYPMGWCNAAQDSIPTAGNFPNRECTSFAYWYFTAQEGKPLSVYGDAKQWVYTANRPVDNTPQVGAIAVSTAGPYGHVMIVLATPGGSYGGFTAPAGYVITMSMNYDYNGHFIVDERAAGSLYYIH